MAQFPKNVLTILTILTKRRNPHFLSLQYKATFPYNVRFSLHNVGVTGGPPLVTVISTPNLVSPTQLCAASLQRHAGGPP